MAKDLQGPCLLSVPRNEDWISGCGGGQLELRGGDGRGVGTWNVQTSSVDLVELPMMNSHSWKMSEKSLLNDSLSFLALAEVISSREKSNTSSERSLRICARAMQAGPSGRGVGLGWEAGPQGVLAVHTAMLFSQSDSLVLLAATMSEMNVGQACGHSWSGRAGAG